MDTIFSTATSPDYLLEMARRHDMTAAALRARADYATGSERDELLTKAERHEADAQRDRERAGA